MRLASLLALPATLVAALSIFGDDSPRREHEQHSYNEHLHLKPLPGGTLYAGFSFAASTPLSAYESQHYRLFPRSLAQILQYTHTAELHLRFSFGRWNEESWGSRPRRGAREGGNGVELWAWLEGVDDSSVETRWNDLVNSLSGLFCASLNFIDEQKTIRPLLSFDSEGALGDLQQARLNHTGVEQERLQLLHGMLPHEVVCTENLTPFLKMLPCKGKAGISSLLDGHKVFDANWQAMSIDVRPVCQEGKECEIEIEQNVDMVLDLDRSMRPRDDPIPRPPPIEEVVCDDTKMFSGHDTCYPKPLEGEMDWSLGKVFGKPVRSSCTPTTIKAGAGKESGDITAEVPSSRLIEILCDGAVRQRRSEDGLATSYTIPNAQPFDLRFPSQTLEQQPSLDEPPLYASRHMTGFGAERGGMHTIFRNPHPYAQRIVYLESLPWFLRPYIHTLHISGGTIEKFFYKPLLDRKRGTHLELVIEVPANSSVELTYDFEKAILRYTEYPPDANRGFDVPAAIVRVLPSNQQQSEHWNSSYYLRTTSLLLPLPTPDFSMPYNVIILTSTVIALGFGSVFNLLVRRFVLAEEVPASKVAVLVQRFRDAVKWLREGRQKGRLVQQLKTEVPVEVNKLMKVTKALPSEEHESSMPNGNGTLSHRRGKTER